jgi:hypothetical protein
MLAARERRSVTGANAVLIIAHPGHELLLHHWMEVAAPVVCVLTDGSGSGGVSRTERSKQIIVATGASVGPVFGRYPDNVWYAAMLERDVEPFARVIDSIVEFCSTRPPVVVVSDPVEYFNPIHDLCSVVARCVVASLPRCAASQHLEYSIEEASRAGNASGSLQLDPAAVDRKTIAISRYAELTSEISRARLQRPERRVDVEQLSPAREHDAWPEHLRDAPFYETYGQRRIETGTYSRLITYADHVRPLAIRIMDSYCRGPRSD